MINRPVFIIASERSGSNLLRKLISMHPDFYAPVSPHLLNAFSNIVPYYFFNKKLEIDRLKVDMCKLVNHPYHNWNLNESDLILVNQKQYSFLDLFDLFYSTVAKLNGANVYVAKEINTQHYIFQILQKIPNARFIHLYRNPLDVVASWKRSALSNMTARIQADKWVSEQKEVWVAKNTFSIPFFNISYEELVSNPHSKMMELFNFLGIENFDLNVNEFSKGEDLSWNDFWKNLNKPIDSNGIGKYTSTLSELEINEVIKICEFQAKELDFKLTELKLKPKDLTFNRKIFNKVGIGKSTNSEKWPVVFNEKLESKLLLVREIKSKIYSEYQLR